MEIQKTESKDSGINLFPPVRSPWWVLYFDQQQSCSIRTHVSHNVSYHVINLKVKLELIKLSLKQVNKYTLKHYMVVLYVVLYTLQFCINITLSGN